MPTVTGPDLRRERRAAEVSVVAVASLMQLSRQAIHNLENAAEPAPERVAQYREALTVARADRVPS